MKIKKTNLRHIIKEELRGVSDLITSAKNIRNHLDMIAADVNNLNKVMGKANSVHQAIENQNFGEVGAVAEEFIMDTRALTASIAESIKEIELLAASLGDTQ